MSARIFPQWMGCLAALCLCTTGCATLRFPWDDGIPEATKRNPVVQIIALWEPSQGRDPEGKACRGFAGQLLFLANKGGTPVAIDGTVRIIEFDQFGGTGEDAQPVHQFDFDSRAWKVHLQTGTLGPTYHVFIPYMRPGNHDAYCELKVEYTPTDAPKVLSDATKVTLRTTKTNAEAVRPVLETINTNDASRTIRTTSIPLDGSAGKTPPPLPADPTQARLERMERMMQEFVAQQAANRVQSNLSPQEEMIADGLASQRMRLDRPNAASAPVEESLAPSVVQASARIPAMGRRNYLSSHPLSGEAAGVAQDSDGTVAHRPARRHPLADEPTFANSDRAPGSNRKGTLIVNEELTDAPKWTEDDATAGRSKMVDLDGHTSSVR